MKTLGIVGGLGPESTVDYYRFIVAEYRRRTASDGSPPLLINSLDIARGIELVGSSQLEALAAWLVEAFTRLAKAGAELGLIAANTPHIVFDEVARRAPIPLLSIVEATCAAAQKKGLQKLALLGTGFTMRARFYPDVFERNGVSLILPSAQEQAFIHEKYLGELLKNELLPQTRDALLAIIDRLLREGAEGVVLAGTELPLLLRGADRPFLDTTLIHVDAAVDALIGD